MTVLHKVSGLIAPGWMVAIMVSPMLVSTPPSTPT